MRLHTSIILVFLSISARAQLISLIMRGDTVWQKNPSTGVLTKLNKPDLVSGNIAWEDIRGQITSDVQTEVNSNLGLRADTILNTTWDGGGKVLRIDKFKVKGTGTLANWIIEAPLTADIFDTSITITNCKSYNNIFSCAWYGAKEANADNWWNIQKSINVGMGIVNCFLPKGNYHYSRPLEIISIYNNAYVGCTLHFYGESSFWGSGAGSTLILDRYFDCGLNLQLNKGSEVDHLNFIGRWVSPQTGDSVYYNTAYDNFNDVSGFDCNDWYYGIAVDWRPPINGSSTNGSTGLKIHDVYVTGFTHLIAISQNNISLNGEILLFENIRLGDGKTGFVTSQAQEKGNMIRGVYAWGRLHTLFRCGTRGQTQAGDWHIDGGNIAGHVIRLFDISVSSWYMTSVSNLFAESIGTIGQIYSAQLPIAFNNCTFHFARKSDVGQMVLLTAGTNTIVFNSCIFRYYGNSDTMDFNGTATFVNCFFSGTVI